MDSRIGVIGGSGVYDIDGLEGAEWVAIETPWGDPSDQILTGTLGGVPMAFLPRHGRGHVHTPTSVPYRANIDALKRLGVTDIISVSACGSFREEMAPGDFVLIDQFIDRTFAREKSFFGPGCVAHVALAHPTCARLSAACLAAALDAGITVHDGGTYLAMEGPQFSTLAEIPHVPRDLGRRCHRHDQHARGQTRARGRALLRLGRHGHRLRLLAPRPRRGRCGHRHSHPHRQCRPRPHAWSAPCPRSSAPFIRPAPTAATTPSTTP